MNIYINIANIIIIALFGASVIYYYNKFTEYFFAILIIIIYWAHLLVSCVYIETGIYLTDMGKYSYATGATFRLFCMIELYMFVFFYLAGKHPIKARVAKTSRKFKDYKLILGLLFGVYIYRLADILVSGTIISNAVVNRFDYYRDVSTFPLAGVISYFSYPLMWLAGYIMLLAEKKRQRFIPIILLVMNIVSLFLIGIQFGGYFQVVLYFFGPLLLKLAKERKLLKLRYAVIVAAVMAVMFLPKYNHFEKVIDEGYADTSFGLNTAYDFLFYRAFGQEADLTWEIDRQIVQEGSVDPDRFFSQIQEILGLDVENTTQYLMQRTLSKSALTRYETGSAVVTGGYPISWALMFGYIFSIPFLMLDAVGLFIIAKLICDGMAKQRLFILLAGGYLLCQAYTLAKNADFSAFGNTIPHIFMLLLLFLYKRPKQIKLGKKRIRI